MARVAIVSGCRTPFVKAGTALAQYSFLDLGAHVVKSAIERAGIAPTQVDELVFSTVLLDPRVPNFAREIVVRGGLPLGLPAHAVSNNCISGIVAANAVAEGIRSGRIAIGVAGGSESMSRPALAWKPEAERFFLSLSRARSFGEKLSVLKGLRPRLLVPIPPSPKEPSTGLTMGQHCELTAQELAISRASQDEVALRSHLNAAAAQQKGYLAEEIVAMSGVDKDNIIRPDTTREKLAKLPAVFERSAKGTISAGNASPLTDGASAICLMAEGEARRLNRPILGYLEAVEYAAIEPRQGLLMAPALALPRLLRKNNLSVESIDLFEVHEAFGAQVVANLTAWEKGWATFPDVAPIGAIPVEKLNVNGGSIAIGHPFAATGGRLILSALNELRRRQKNTAVLSVCAAGAMAAAVLLRRE